MAITRYAGDRFTIKTSDTKPTGVLDGAYLIDTGNLTQWVRRSVGGTSQWAQLAGGGGGGGTPGGANTQVQFNNAGAFGGDADLTFTNGNRLNVNKLGISGNIYDSNNYIGEGGMVLTNEGTTGVNWKSIESVLSGVGGSGVANYVARWSDEDTLTSGIIYDNATKVGISTASPQAELHIYAGDVAGDHLLVESTNAAAGDAPDLVLYRNSPSPANSDDLGIIRFRGKNNGTDTGYGENKVIYADIEAEITSVVSGSEGAALKFYTQDNGSFASRMVITGANVGIGTNDPEAPLTVAGPMGNQVVFRTDQSTASQRAGGGFSSLGHATATSRYARLFLDADGANFGGVDYFTIEKFGNSGEVKLLQYSNANMSFWVNTSTQAMTIKNDGNVGIGTNNPVQRLHLQSPQCIVRVVSTTANSNSSIWFNSNVGGTNADRWEIGTNISAGSSLEIYDRLNGASRMVVKNDGNVGIGTNDPAARLYVLENAANWAAIIKNSNAGGYGLSIDCTANTGTTVYALAVYTGVGTGLFVRNTGNVGIGTAQPVYALDIYKSVTGDWLSRLHNTATSGNSSGLLVRMDEPGSTGFAFAALVNGNYKLAVKPDGKVGIGEAAPDAILEIANNDNSSYRFGYGGTSDVYLDADDVYFRSDSGATNHVTKKGTLVGIGTASPVYNLQGNGLNGGIIGVTRTSGSTNGTLGHVRFGNTDIDSDLANIKGIQDGATDSARLQFETHPTSGSATARMTIKSDGKVGIGTTDPNTLLHLEDDTATAGLTLQGAGPGYVNAAIVLKATNGTSVRGLGVFMHDAGGDTEWYAGTPYAAADNYVIARKASQASPDYGTAIMANALFTIDNNGNVGLGITDPAHNLHVSGDAIISGYLYDSTNSTGVDGYVLTSKEDGPQWKLVEDVLSGVGGNGTANYVSKWVDSDTIGNSIIYDDGDVGISTASPDAKLHVFDTVVSDLAIFESSGPSSANAPDVVLYRSSASPADADDLGRIAFRGRNDNSQDINYANIIAEAIDVSDGTEDGALRFNTYLTGASTETMVLRSANVGIGTNNPEQLLEISATGDAAIQIQSTKTSLANNDPIGSIIFKNNDSSGTDPHICGKIASIAETVYGRAGLAFSTGRTTEFDERMRISWDGNVGIGTDAPSARLFIKGGSTSRAFQAVGSSTTAGVGYFYTNEIHTGTTTNATVSIRSDHASSNGQVLHVRGDGSGDLLTLDQGGTSRVVVKANGNVGIGTDAPAAKLEVADGAVLIKNDLGGATDHSELNIFKDTGDNSSAAILRVGYDAANSYMIQRQRASGSIILDSQQSGSQVYHQINGDTIFTVDSSNVLFYKSAEFDAGIKDKDGSFGTNGYVLTTDGVGDVTWAASPGSGSVDGSGTANYVSKWTDSDTIGNSSIFDNGDVGIGTNAPSSKLHVNSEISCGADDNNRAMFGYTPSRFYLGTRQSGTNYLNTVSVTSGNVGIGTVTPEAELHAHGTTLTGRTSGDTGSYVVNSYDLIVSNGGSGTVVLLYNDAGAFQSSLIKYDTNCLKLGLNSSNSTNAISTATAVNIGSVGVGIGTDDPGSKLEVYAASGLVASHVKSGTVISRLTANSTASDGVVGTSSAHDFLIQRAGSTRMTFSGSSVVVNDSGEDIDFRVEGDTDANLIRTDAANDRVGIGTNAPLSKFNVLGTQGNWRIDPDGVSNEIQVLSTTVANDGFRTFRLRTNETVFDTGGSERMRIKSDGNVGIGTNAPLANLMVGAGARNAGAAVQNQTAYFSGTKSAFADPAYKGLWQGQLHIADDSALAAGIGGAITFGATQDNTNGTFLASIEGSRDNATSGQYGASMIFRTRTNGSAVMGAHMVINSVGNVGIGTDDPAYLLDVYETGSNIAIFRSTSTGYARVVIRAGASGDAQLVFQESTSSKWRIGNDGGDSDKFKIDTGSGAFDTSPMVAIDTTGKVGIGTNGPNAHLHVEKSAGTTTVLTQVAANSTVGYEIKKTGSTTQHWKIVDGQTVNGTLEFYDATDSATRMAINGNGSVGIGTAAPAKLLTVKSATSPVIGLYSAYADSNARNWAIASNNAAYGDFTISNSAANGGDPTAIKLSILKEGSVGIGTNAPESKLHVEGALFASSSIKMERTGAAAGDNDAGLIFSTSSARTDSQRIGGVYFGAAGTNYGLIRGEMDGSAGGKIYFVAGSQTNPISNTSAKTLEITAGTISAKAAIRPLDDSTYTLGQSSLKWSELYVDSIKDVNNNTGSANQVLSAGSGGGSLDWVSLSEITGVDGSGTANYIPKWTDSDTIGNSIIYDDGDVGIGTDAPATKLHVEDSTSNTTATKIRVQGGSRGFTLGKAQTADNYAHLRPITDTANALRVMPNGTTAREAYVEVWNKDYETGANSTSWHRGMFYIDTSNDVYLRADGYGTAGSVFIGTENNTQTLTIKDSGNVGIGTATPGAPVHIFSDGTSNTPEIVLCLGANTSNAPTLQFSENTNAGFNTGMSIAYRGDYGAGDANALAIQSIGADATTSGAPVVTFKSGGNVGIGTTAPAGKLEIVGSNGTVAGTPDTDTEELVIRNNDRCGIQLLSAESAGKTSQIIFGSASDINAANVKWSYNEKLLSISTQNAAGEIALRSANGAEAVRIDTDGSVGIGTDAPTSPLTIKSSSTSATDSGLTIQGNSNTNAIVKIAEKSTDGARLHLYDGGVEKIAFYTDGTANHISAGSVGIGTNNPSNRLHIEGTTLSNASIRIEKTTTGINEDPGLVLAAANNTDGYRIGSIFFQGGATSYAQIRAEMNGTAGAKIYFVAGSQTNPVSNSSTKTLELEDGTITAAAAFRPLTDSSYTLGQASLKWSELYVDKIKDVNNSTGSANQILSAGGSGGSLDWISLSEISGVDGSGTANTIPRWTDSDTIGDSIITVPSNTSVQVAGPLTATGNITVGPSNNSKIYMGGNDYIAFTDGVGDGFKFVYDNSEKVRITNVGKVGIGTVTPQGKLDINTEAAEATHVYINGEANQDKLLYFRHYSNSEGAGATGYVGYIGSKGNDNLLSLGHLNSSGTDVPIMHLAEDGHVGIGTTDPAQILDVYETGSNLGIFRSTATTYARLLIRSGSTGDAQLAFQNNTSTKWSIGNDGGDSDKFKIVVGAGAFGTSPIVAIDTAGKVGVGSNAPAFNLDVTGTGHYTGLLNLNAGLYLARESDSLYGTYIKGGSQQFPASPAAYYSLGKYVMNTASYSYDTLTGHVVVGYGNPNTNDSFAKITFTVYFRDNNSLATGAPYVTWTYNVEGKFTFQSDPPFRVSKTQDVSGGAKTYELQFSVGANYGTAHWKVCYSNVSTTNAVTIYDYAATIGTAISDGRVTRQGYQIYPGCVGIGTATQAPPAMLTTQGPSTGATTLGTGTWGIMMGPEVTRSTTANTYYPGIAFNHLLNNGGLTTWNNHPQAWIGTRLHDTSGSERAFLVFSTKSGTGLTSSDVPSERMCIDPVDGFVGIGTTNPQVLLDVYRTDSDTARFESTSTSRSTVSIRSGSGGDAQVRFQNGASSKWSIGNDGGDSDKFKIAVGSGAFSTSEAVAISTSGCVGIGTNSPLEPLHVYDGGDWQIRMSSGGARAGLVIDKPGTTTTMGSALVVAADETYRLGTASYYHVVMQQGGTVSLQYQGSTRLNTTSGGVTVTGTLTETSSITLKENVETYTPSLDIINKIRPVKYNRKTNKDKKEIGLIAEELAELFPELVEKDEKGNPSSVNYSRAVTVLLGGFKELYKEIEELKKRI